MATTQPKLSSVVLLKNNERGNFGNNFHATFLNENNVGIEGYPTHYQNKFDFNFNRFGSLVEVEMNQMH